MYRPDGWRTCIKIRNDEKRYTSKELCQVYEAGADAMLKGLREGATQVSNLGELPQAKGVVVFIPDES